MHDVKHEYIQLHHMFLKNTLFELLYTVIQYSKHTKKNTTYMYMYR